MSVIDAPREGYIGGRYSRQNNLILKKCEMRIDARN